MKPVSIQLSSFPNLQYMRLSHHGKMSIDKYCQDLFGNTYIHTTHAIIETTVLGGYWKYRGAFLRGM